MDKPIGELDLSKQQQSVQRPQTGGAGLPRKSESDSHVKSTQQLQQQQQQQAYQQPYQQPQVSAQPAGAPPGLQQANGARGAIQTQPQAPYYGLDMGYMHQGYGQATSPVAPVGAVAPVSAIAAGASSAHSTTSGAVQQQQPQQQPYPNALPGMPAMSPYGTAYNPYFNYQAAGYYYNQASAPNFYGRGQGMYQPPRGAYPDPYPQAMGGGMYATDMYGQPAMTGQFGDSLYGRAMGMHGAQGAHQGGGPGAVGGSGTGKGNKNGNNTGAAQSPATQEHGHAGAGYGYGNPNPYTHNARDGQTGGQWAYQQPSPAWNQQMMQQQQQQYNAPAGASGVGFGQQFGMQQGRHDGNTSRPAAGSNNGSYGSSYNRGGSAAGAQGGASHQPTW